MTTQQEKPAKAVRYRDAVTGRYVTKEEAEQRPRETIREARRPAPEHGRG